jgi:hypothetical protein
MQEVQEFVDFKGAVNIGPDEINPTYRISLQAYKRRCL